MAKKEFRLVAKITKETQEGKIKWEVINSIPSSLSQSERPIENIYKAKIADQTFRLFKYESKYYIDEDQFEWRPAFRFEMLQPNSDRSSYTFPELVNLSDLYGEVRRQIAGVDNFLNNYLGDEKDEENPFNDDPF